MSTEVRFESPVKNDALPFLIGIDLVIGVLVVAVAFAIGMPWASLLTLPVVAMNGASFWLVYPRALQVLDDGVRVKTGGLAGSHVRFDEIGSVELVDGSVQIRASDGRALLKPLALKDGEETVERLSETIDRMKLAA